MGKLADTVQKRVGLIISIIGLAVVITNIVNRTIRVDFLYAVMSMTVFFLLPIVILFIISVFIESRIFKIIQLAALALMGSVNIMQSANEFYGPSLFLAAWLLARQYGFLENRRTLKNSIILIFLVGLSQFSSFLHAGEHVYQGFTTLFFTLFLVSILLIVWRDMFARQEELKTENRTLITDYKKLTSQLEDIEEGKKPYDLKASEITQAEERVIRILTLYKASNREIAERLDISESTVKLHLYNIYNKIGVDNRFSIIELCKYNFADAE